MPLEDSRGRAPAALQWESVSVDLGSSPLFRQKGEYWTIAYDGVVFRLRDTKGLHIVSRICTHQDGGTDDRGAPRRARTSSERVYQDRQLLYLHARSAPPTGVDGVTQTRRCSMKPFW
jgi:hypothetical protein